MNYQEVLPTEIKSYIEKTDWSQKGFSNEKAYVCAHFARLAYKNVPQFELDGSGRIKAVPCDAYQEIVKTQVQSGLQSLLTELDLPGFVIERSDCVVVGVKIRKVVFVAVRGTANAYDWGVNLRFGLVRMRSGPCDIYLHRGYFATVLDCFDLLQQEIARLVNGNHDIPVYVTGHSLGGAMAAIIHSFCNLPFLEWPRRWYGLRADESTHSCFTFGMPRYGDFMAVSALSNPHHILRKKDIVPYVPAKWMGYADCSEEYLVAESDLNSMFYRKNMYFVRSLLGVPYFSQKSNHRMEQYVEDVRGSCR